jgi:hypothetical protein
LSGLVGDPQPVLAAIEAHCGSPLGPRYRRVLTMMLEAIKDDTPMAVVIRLKGTVGVGFFPGVDEIATQGSAAALLRAALLNLHPVDN